MGSGRDALHDACWKVREIRDTVRVGPVITFLHCRYPFHGAEHSGLFAKIRRGQFTLPENLSSRAKCLIKCLLRTGIFPVDVRDDNDKTPLHYAALNGADEVFQLLVDNKADLDALDGVGATPLHFAVR